MKIITQDEDETLIQCTVECITVGAIRILGLELEEIWLPRSLIEVVSEDYNRYEILIPNWLAEEKEIV